MTVNEIMKKYINNNKVIDDNIRKSLEQIEDIDNRSDYFNYLYLWGQDAREQHRKGEVRFCVSNMIQVMRDQNQRLYRNMEWDSIIPTQEHLEFMEYGMQLSERLYKMETYKLIFLNIIMSSVIVGITLLFFNMELERAVTIGSVFFIIDAIILVFVRKHRTQDIVRTNLSKNVSLRLIDMVINHKNEYE